MKFTYSWLKDHLEPTASFDQIVERLSLIGLEVEGVEDKAKQLAPFVVGEVLTAQKHPNADKLKVCTVSIGKGDPIQVVCGAPNARAGLKTVFAAPGTVIPATGTELKIGKIRDVESRGMLCSAREMGLSEEHEGIIELPEDAPVGAPFAEVLGLNDPVIEIAVTPNRADCLGVSGVARDLAAAGLGELMAPRVKPVEGTFPAPLKVTLEFGDTPSLCPAFALRVVKGVKNGPSPQWLQDRLRAIGLRPINALVDVTNFMTFDRNRPLHVFDLKKVAGDLVVRRAKTGETLLALDGKTYTLDESMCVIADEKGVESLAGIMGGEESGCDAATVDVVIESALWEPINIAQTGRRLGINSDARFRFERGIDPAFTLPGLDLATHLILEMCGGEPSQVVLAGAIPDTARTIAFPLAEVKRLSGLDASEAEIRDVLEKLGFAVSGSTPVLDVVPPSWRGDIEGKADLVEEVVRILGLERVPATEFPRDADARKPVLTALQLRTRKARRALAARGLVEAVTWSFVSKGAAEAFGGGKPELALSNPIAADLSDMRPSLLPGLIRAAQANADRGFADVALFEVGQVFLGDGPGDQRQSASGIRRGTAKPGGAGRFWAGAAGAVDAFDAKADAFAALAACGAPVANLQVTADAPSWYHPGRSGTLRLGSNAFAHFGEVHPAVLEALDVTGPLVAFEITLDKIPEPKAKATRVKPPLELSAFQPVRRDFAFLVGREVAAADILKAAQGVDRKLVTGVGVFDLYEGKGIEADKKSVAIEVTLQPRERTLTDEEIDQVAGRIVAEVAKKTGAVLRA
ncbi:phenylalanine--tRNA ligase subunit beta [Xanthobacter tagetidis]|uniref:Phenylalanine--tRNA ligase beta subunit n=1 Tax=Xanthobacter tagetidis TaxID=60216 RepID=A0A3L7AKX7_9HYPH|nr:phenylalanine--tRNA ligase subunit beta [Xanthobacter tagetidis]MBB6306914.1 phenylalanyl-tRNA synthetase beta chain [Xanthobacter tagetidis]RLP80022.1 phenylalanine--tRNA ligase subunit beta [Xanthobacter tagetidis]